MRIGSVLLALAGIARGTPARAGDSCAGIRGRGAPDLPSVWDDAVRRLLTEVSPASGAGCAAVTLAVEPALDGGVRLLAMTADGRYTERTVERPSALVATALGLVVSIPEEETRDLGTAERSEGPSVSPVAEAAIAGRVAPAPAPVAASRLELWLGAAAGARIGQPSGYEMLDFEVRADAMFRGWLLAVTFRYAPSMGPDASDFVLDEAVVGVGVGRRIPLGRGALDLSVVPAFVAMNLRWDQDDSDPQTGTNSAFLLGGAARWSTPIAAGWRFTATADAEAAPFGLVHPSNLGADEPAFPIWTAGLRLGASGELL
jgi:hypothetical protein